MSLSGTLDFQRPLRSEAEGLLLYFPFERGTMFVLPETLTLAPRPHGGVDFALTAVRGVSPNMPPVPHGLVELGVQGRYPTDRGLRAALTLSTRPSLAPAPYQAGFLRWQVTAQSASLPADLQVPVPLRCDGLGAARLVAVVAPRTLDFLKKALDTSTLLTIRAVADLDIGGLAPRLPLTIRFDPARLLTSLHAGADASGFVTDAAVVDFFRQPLPALPLTLSGPLDTTQSGEFAETMRDWVRSRFGQFAPAPTADLGVGMRLARPDGFGPGEFVWDLSVPLLTGRGLQLELNPLQAARQVVAERGLAAFWHEVTVPTLSTGNVLLTVCANLPDHRANVLMQGAELMLPPRLPGRPAAIHQTVEFVPPNDQEDLILRLSPAESMMVEIMPFVILQMPSGVRRIQTEKRFVSLGDIAHSNRIMLTVNDFTVDYVFLHVTEQLLEQATVFVRLVENNTVLGGWIPLTQTTPSRSLAWPTDTPKPTLDVEARPLTLGKVLSMRNLPFTSIYLGLELFAEFGPRTVSVTAQFGPGESLIAIDLLPETLDDLPANRNLIFLTPAQAQKMWTYLVTSPFRAGFRYRRHLDDGPGRWSTLQDSAVVIVDRTLQ